MVKKRAAKRVGVMGPKKAVSEQQKAWYDRLLDTHPAIERKGRNLLYTSVNGHMFTVFSTGARLGIRLPKDERDGFIERFKTELLVSYGVVMKEYVSVPDELLADTDALAPYLAMSYDYVRSLEPKATTKRK